MPNRNGPEYPPGYRRLARHSLFGDKCGGWLAVGPVCCERVCIDFPVNVRVQRCKFTYPDTFRSPETSASSSVWSLDVTTWQSGAPVAAAGVPIYIRCAPASITAVNDARRHILVSGCKSISYCIYWSVFSGVSSRHLSITGNLGLELRVVTRCNNLQRTQGPL